MPPSHVWFNAGKILTRALLKPELKPLPCSVELFGTIPFRIDLGSFVGNDLYCFDHQFEATTTLLWRKLAKESRFIVDIGSHIGTFACLAGHENPQAKVFAIEPDISNFAFLTQNVKSLSNVHVVQCGIGPTDGNLYYHLVPGNDGGGYLSEKPEGSASQVPVFTLDTFCLNQSITTIDLMKLDVEGLEHEIIASHKEFLKHRGPRHIIAEIRKEHRDPKSAEDLMRNLTEAGYTGRRIEGLYALPFGKKEDLANWHFYKGKN